MARFILEKTDIWPKGVKNEKFMIHNWYPYSPIHASEGENIFEILRIIILNIRAKINTYS